MIRAGEAGGVLDGVLKKLSAHYRRQAKLNEEVKSALYYPAAVMIVALLAVFFLLSFVVPTLMAMFTELGAGLPLPTRMLMGIADFMENWWWLVGGAFALAASALILFIRTARGKRIWDTILLKLPVAGKLLSRLIIARFTSTLAMLLDSGVNLIPSLEVVGEVVDNTVIADILRDARLQIEEGVNFSTPLEASGKFPPMVLQMIMIGEETGSLEHMLNRISDYYEIEVENAIEGGISLIEPVMIVLLGGVVGFIAISVILPLFDMYSAIM